MILQMYLIIIRNEKYTKRGHYSTLIWRITLHILNGNRVGNLQEINFAGRKFGQKKTGKLLISHRSTAYPCYLPILGEFCRSWPYKTCRLQI